MHTCPNFHKKLPNQNVVHTVEKLFKKLKMCTVRENIGYVLKTERDIAKMVADLKFMKSDHFVIKFWRKLEIDFSRNERANLNQHTN